MFSALGISNQFFLSFHTEAKTKWQRLRNNFSKAIERRVKTPRSRSAATKLQKPWAYETDMDFIRSHLHYHKASSSSLARQAPAGVGSRTLSPQQDIPDVLEKLSENTLTSCSSSPRSALDLDFSEETSKKNKAPKRGIDELDPAALPCINKTSTRSDQTEDPAIGWFKSLLPMYNTLSPIEKLEFQSRVTLELRSFLLAKEQRMTHQPKPSLSNSPTTSNIQQ